MEEVILSYAPDYWNKSETSVSKQFAVNKNSEEYRQIYFDVCRATGTKSLTNILRVQNIYDLGQMLIREQLKIKLHNYAETFYRVRRFINIKKHYMNIALQYNLDYRRCGLSELKFKQKIGNNLRPDDVLLVVQVVTNKPYAPEIVPDNSSDYFIEYIVNWE